MVRSSAGTPHARYAIATRSEGAHTDVLAKLFRKAPGSDETEFIGLASTTQSFPTELPGSGCLTFTLAQVDTTVPLTGPGEYTLKVGLGASMKVIYTTKYTLGP